MIIISNNYYFGFDFSHPVSVVSVIWH